MGKTRRFLAGILAAVVTFSSNGVVLAANTVIPELGQENVNEIDKKDNAKKNENKEIDTISKIERREVGQISGESFGESNSESKTALKSIKQNSTISLRANSDDLTSASKNFTYRLNDKNEATITGYNGSADTIFLSDAIDGYKLIGIGDYAFDGHSDLTDISLPDSLTYIGACAFQGTGIESITIPKNVRSSGYSRNRGAMSGAMNLKKIVFEYGMTEIPAFICASAGYSSVTEIMIPDTVNVIGNRAFSECTSLLEVDIPKGVSKIGDEAFYRCSNLARVTMHYNDSLINTETQGMQPFRVSIGVYAFSECSKLTDVELSENVISIEKCAFGMCTKLESLVLPESLTYLGHGVINWTRINSIIIPKNIKNSGISGLNGAMSGATGLKKIVFEEGMTKIPDYICASGDSRSYILAALIPRSVTDIGKYAFYKCNNLVIYGYEDSYAKTYADENNIPFKNASEFEFNSNIIPENGSKELDFNILVKGNSVRGSGSVIRIQGAEVSLYNHNNQKIGSEISNNTGMVFFEHLEGGHSYSVKVSAFGYKMYEKRDLELTDDGQLEDIYLEDNKDEFSLGYDSNSFRNNSKHFLVDKKTSGWLGKAYSVSRNNYDKLRDNEPWYKKNRILATMNLEDSEWYGACHGIVTTMMLAGRNEFDVSKYKPKNAGDTNKYYADLQMPKEDIDLLDDINYYQLAQDKYSYKYTSRTWNSQKLLGLKINDNGDDVSNRQFFDSFIEEARKMEPFILNFGCKNYNKDINTEEDGFSHTVLIIGLEEETENEYIIRCCDPSEIDAYLFFIISKDLQNMYFCLGSSNGDAIYRNKEGKFDWIHLRYLTQEQLHNNIEILSHGHNGQFRLMQDTNSEKEQELRTFLYIDTGSPFHIENESGQKLIYNGISYSGDMNVYSISTNNHEAKEKMIYEIDNSSYYNMSEFEAGTEIQIGNNDYFYSIAPSVQGKIVFTLKGVEMHDMNTSGGYSFESEMATRQAGDEIIRIDGNAEGNSSLAVDGHNIILNSEIGLSGITAEKITEDGTINVNSENRFKNGIIGTDSEENFQISTESLVENIILESKENLKNSDVVQFRADVFPKTASNQTLVWSSDNPSVATVDQNGLVTAVAVGKATITVSSTDGSNVSASCVITVTKSDNTNPPDSDNTGGNGSNGNNSGGNSSGTTDDNTTGGNTSSGGSTGDNPSGGTTGGSSSSGGTTGGSSSSGGSTGNNPSSGTTGGSSSSGGATENNPSGGTTGGSSSGGNSSGGDTNNSNGDPAEDNNKPDDSIQIKLLYYIIEFNANAGTKLSRKTMTLLNDDNLGILPKVQRKNYTFNGWYTQKTGGSKVSSSTVLNAGTTLFAQWTKVNKPSKVKAPTLKSNKAGQLAVSFQKITGAKGYEIAYSTNKKFPSSSTKKIVSASVKKTIKKLKSKKKYYVKIRAYKVDSMGIKIYGTYSKVKSVKIK